MALLDDGPPLCPRCDSVTQPHWNFCAMCGADLDGPDLGGHLEDDEQDEDVDHEPTLDHTDPDDLRRAFENSDSIKAAAERFEVSYSAVRQAMIDNGIYTPRTYDR